MVWEAMPETVDVIKHCQNDIYNTTQTYRTNAVANSHGVGGHERKKRSDGHASDLGED